jgi:aspartyl-tRNA(Asn)/glutamyl-tRNA(Gln) amidotransferase subunit B
MASAELKEQYNVTIGIECHVQLKTKTKLFSGADNDAREAEPNTLVNHIDFGLPGALPVLNAEALPLAARAAFALGTEPQKFSKFDRKHYFYPDLPMGYQITQFDQPIILGGQIEFLVDGKPKIVSITRAHLEADAGKSTHPTNTDYSLVDLNRAGTPLLEIVSEPDMHSAAEAKAYARELYLRMKYAGVSEANLYYGNMRFDVNVSVSKSGDMGTRTETKNLNSFRSVEKAVEYEVNRQIDELEKGNEIIQETRGWDDTALKTFSQRTKEDAHDYRYFPDPDLPPVTVTDEFIAKVKAEMSELPNDYRTKFKEIGLTSEVIEDIVAIPESAMAVSRILAKSNAEHARRVAFWLMQPVSDEVDSEAIESKVSDEALIKLSELVADNKLSSTAAKQVLTELLANGGDPELIAESKNLIQESDEGAITEIVKQVITDNPKAAEDVKNGEMKAIGFLTGQVMKLSQGKANPALAQELIKKQLGL